MITDIIRLFKHSAIYAIGSAMQSLVGFLLIPLYTRNLTPSEYGALEILNTVLAILNMILSFGFASAILKCHERDCKTEEDRKTMIGTAFLFALPLMGVVSVALWFAAPSVARMLIGSDPLFADYLMLTLIINFFAVTGNLCFSVLRSKEKSGLYTLLNFIRFATFLGLNICFILTFHWGVRGVLLGNLFSQMLLVIVAVPLLKTSFRFRWSSSYLRALLAFGIPLIPSSLAMWIMDLSDRYFLKHYASLADVGLYSLGYKIGMVISILLVIPFQLAWPTFSFSIAEQKNVKEIYARVLTYYLIVTTTFALFLSLFGRTIVDLLGTPTYAAAAQVVPLVAFAYVLFGVHYAIVPGLHLMGKTKYYPWLVIIPAIVNIALNSVVVPRFGMIGAALTTLFSFSLMVVITYALSTHYFPIRYEWKRIILLGAATAIILIASFLLPTAKLSLEIAKNSLLLVGFLGLLAASGIISKGEIAKARALFVKR